MFIVRTLQAFIVHRQKGHWTTESCTEQFPVILLYYVQAYPTETEQSKGQKLGAGVFLGQGKCGGEEKSSRLPAKEVGSLW